MIRIRIIVCSSIIIALSAGIFLYVQNEKSGFEYQLKKIGIALSGVGEFTVKEIAENKITAEKGGEIIKIEMVKNLNKEKVEEYINNQTALLIGIFEPQLPPYPEFLTKESGCAEKYKPKEYQSNYGKYFTLYAGDRLGYGVCVDDLIHYKASLGYFYCPIESTLFTIEYFVSDKEDFNKIINLNNSVTCK